VVSGPLMAQRRGGKGENPVRDAVDAVGGIIKACALAGTTPTTMYAWLRAGHVRLAKPCLLLAEASGVSARRLAGLEV
jgi:hypothetical protein